MSEISNNNIFSDIKQVMIEARNNVASVVNVELLKAYWQIGRIIVEHEQDSQERATYGSGLLNELSKELTKEFGRGFSVSNLQFIRRFYQDYPIQQTLSVKLSWSHYCELLRAEDVLKDPYVFEFLGMPENKLMMESDLERALVDHIEKFLLELGRGFMFVGTQQRITLNNTHYYVDMVFYNKILRSYILIELKTSKLMPEAVGQLNMYLNYYQSEVNDEIDNPPIGIILCTDKDNVAAEYALGGLSNQIFASKYTLYIPDKERLIKEVEAIIEEWHEEQ